MTTANENNQGGGGNTTRKPQKFTVELGNSRNSKITIDTLKSRFRGHFSLAKLHNRPGGGRDVGAMSAMPEIQGIHLEVDPTQSTVRIYDPLIDKKEVLDQVNGVLARNGIKGSGFKAIEETTRKLNENELKTLCIELRLRVEQKKAKVREGVLPTDEQIERMPGEELFDPWSESHTQPKLKKDWPAYARKVQQTALS